VEHRLFEHPLLSLEALAELAEGLPEGGVEHHRGELPAVLPGGETPQLEGVGAGDLVRGIGSNGCWVVLWNIERSPRYGELLDECLAEITPYATPGERVVLREGFVFISAPGSVTPVHIDPEHNVLLQFAGEKTMHVGRFVDEADRHAQIERVVLGGHRWLPTAATEEQRFDLTPGRAVYVPPFTPHRVRNGDGGPCISLSVTWRTAEFYRREQAYEFNAKVRRLGLSPKPPGGSALRDGVKAGLRVHGGKALGTARRVLAGRVDQ
jgi:mannose-6-phosphate isomerase-like protein (cupin superfamily)